MDLTVAAEILRDESVLFNFDQLSYEGGKIRVPVGFWARQRLRELSEEERLKKEKVE